MQNYCKTIGALAAASALVAGTAQAEVEYELHTGYTSEYVFRGLDRGDNLTEVGVDAAYEWNGLSLSAGIWAAAFEAPNRVNNPNIPTGNQIDNEIDMYAEVSKDFGFLTASVGYIYYWNLGRLGPDNQEVYGAISHDFGFANVSLSYFLDVDSSYRGDTDGYTELALSRSFELNQCLNLNIATNVGYLADNGEFTAWTTKASLDWGFAERAKLSPFIAVSIGMGEQANTKWHSTENELFGGSMLSVGF